RRFFFHSGAGQDSIAVVDGFSLANGARETAVQLRVTGQDRRRGPRAPLVAAVRSPQGPQLFLSQDLSPRGMTVLRAEEAALAARTSLQIEFELPGCGFVRVLARVAHDGQQGGLRRTGLEFLHLSAEQSALVAGYVESATAT